MMAMADIKRALNKRFDNLGCSASFYATTEFSFGIDRHHGKFLIASANPKKLEIILCGSDTDFNVPCVPNNNSVMLSNNYIYRHGSYTHVVRKRFNKYESSIDAIINWVAEAKKSHNFLRVLLHPEESPGEPFQFSDGTFVISSSGSAYHGYLISIKVLDIITISGHSITHMVHVPDNKPWLLVEIQNRMSNVRYIVTDGESWYPISCYNHESYRIFHPDIFVLNQSDKALLNASVAHYIERISAEPAPKPAF